MINVVCQAEHHSKRRRPTFEPPAKTTLQQTTNSTSSISRSLFLTCQCIFNRRFNCIVPNIAEEIPTVFVRKIFDATGRCRKTILRDTGQHLCSQQSQIWNKQLHNKDKLNSRQTRHDVIQRRINNLTIEIRKKIEKTSLFLQRPLLKIGKSTSIGRDKQNTNEHNDWPTIHLQWSMTFPFTKADRWSSSYLASFSQFDKRILMIIFFSIDFYRCILSAKVRGVSEQLLCFPDCCASPLSSATKEKKKSACHWVLHSFSGKSHSHFVFKSQNWKRNIYWSEMKSLTSANDLRQSRAVRFDGIVFFFSSLHQTACDKSLQVELHTKKIFFVVVFTVIGRQLRQMSLVQSNTEQQRRSTFYRKWILKKKTAAE